jgi:hypothetical protein
MNACAWVTLGGFAWAAELLDEFDPILVFGHGDLKKITGTCQ